MCREISSIGRGGEARGGRTETFVRLELNVSDENEPTVSSTPSGIPLAPRVRQYLAVAAIEKTMKNIKKRYFNKRKKISRF